MVMNGTAIARAAVMRSTACLVVTVGSLVLVACVGGGDPESSGRTSAEQKAGTSTDGTSNASSSASDQGTNTGSSNDANGSNGSTTPPEGPTSCFKDFGPNAPGECTIGDVRNCDDYD